MSSDLNVTVYDHALEGGVDQKGTITQFSGSRALENSIKMWILSFRGEVIRVPGRGGYVIPHLMKPMTDERTEDIRLSIIDGIAQDFTPQLRLLRLNVVPDYVNRIYNISMVVFAPALKTDVSVDVSLRSSS